MGEQIVYVAECGIYEDMYVAAVYASPEAAMAALPGTRWTATIWHGGEGTPDWVTWENDLHGNDFCTIRPVRLEQPGERRSPDVCQRQVLNRKTHDWDYVPATESEIQEAVRNECLSSTT